MNQKLLNPFKFKKTEIFPGIIIQNDIILSVKACFEFNSLIFKTYYYNRIAAILASINYQDLRTAKSMYGISSNADFDKTVSVLVENIIGDMFCIIRALTSKDTPQELMTNIMCDVKLLPETVFKLVQLVNSCNFVQKILGTESSIIRFHTREVTFISKTLDSKEVNKTQFVLAKILKINEIFKILKVEPLVSLNNLSELFTTSEHSLNAIAKVNYLEDNKTINSYSLQISDGMSQEDLRIALMSGANYEFDNHNIIESINYTLNLKELNDIFRLPVQMLMDSSNNYGLTESFVNDYIDSTVASQSNKKVSYDGFKKTKDSKRNISRKVKTILNKTNVKGEDITETNEEKWNRGENIVSE